MSFNYLDFSYFSKEVLCYYLPMKYFFIGIVFAVAVYFLYGRGAERYSEKNIFQSRAFTEYFEAQGCSSFENPRKLNGEFIEKIRREGTPEQVCALFLGVNLTKAFQDYLFQKIKPFQEGDFFNYLRISLKALNRSKQKTTLSNDSYKEGNLPFWQFTFNGVKVIRMGLPIIETPYLQSLVFPPSINPEFASFLKTTKRHLYVNLMKRKGLEGPCSLSLEKTPGLTVVTLDKNSDFYWQKGEFPEDAESFKAIFFKQMMDPKGAYFWPFDIALEPIFDKVHADYFHNKLTFDTKERQDFIELAYLEILDFLVETLKPETMNITCQHAIDRAPSLSVLWQFKHGLASENEVAALLFTPPLLMHNRSSHESRLERFISAASFFYPKKQSQE